jgi:hypothetical protein
MDLLRAGRSLYLSERPGAAPHLWLVLTDPHGNPPEVVLTMVRTRKRFTDDTVILNVGDHPFVKHESCVHYSDAQRFSVAAIMQRAAEGHCELRADMTSALLARVRQGLRDSPFTVYAIKDYCAGRW